MMKRFNYCFLLLLLFAAAHSAYAQEQTVLGTNLIQQPVSETPATDTLPALQIDEEDLEHIIDLRTQFEKQNRSYSEPVPPSEELLRFLKKDELEMSEEALYWARLVRDASTLFDEHMTFRDTIIVNPLFMPIVFKGDYLPHTIQFYDLDSLKGKTPYDNLYPADSIFQDLTRTKRLEEMAYKYVQNNYPTHFRYSIGDLPVETLKPNIIKKSIHEDIPLKIKSDVSFEDVDAPVKFIPERRYWTSNFESSIQFAQAYFSPNWHDGNQNTNINLNTRNYFKYDYNKDKVKLTNELELKISANNAPKDTIRSVSIADNDIRIHSNFGYQAYRKWYYTLDLNVNSKIFDSYNVNDTVTRLSGFLAPLTVTLGVGMKYDLNKKLNGNKYRNVHFDVNIAPLSMTYRYSRYKERFDFGRHGFDASKVDDEGNIRNHQTYIGSNIKANLKWQFNRNTIWTSRFEYDTSYHRIFWVFENRLEMAISRFFSTQITLNMRYDDAGKKNTDLKDSYLQINEALTFGFSYRW